MLALSSRLRWLRRLIIAQLALLAIQYEVGMTLSISGTFPDVQPAGFSLGTIASYVAQGGPALVIHSVLGVLILANALVVFLLALPLRIRWFRVMAAVDLVFVLSAGLGGLQFVLSGFLDDNSSYQMSTGFIVAIVFTFLAFYFLRAPIEPAAELPGQASTS